MEQEQRNMVMSLWHKTAGIKAKAVADYVKELLANSDTDDKFLVFAYHRCESAGLWRQQQRQQQCLVPGVWAWGRSLYSVLLARFSSLSLLATHITHVLPLHVHAPPNPPLAHAPLHTGS
jgi:hypothetical protein